MPLRDRDIVMVEGSGPPIPADDLRPYDFVDLGAGAGHGLEWVRVQTGLRGLGVELNARKVDEAQKRGEEVRGGDLFSLPREPCVRFTMLDNVLEHLADEQMAADALGVAIDLAQDFVYVRHPSFDHVDYLATLGLKTYWTDWRGHTVPWRIGDLVAAGLNAGAVSAEVYAFRRLESSDDDCVIPADAGIDQFHYDPESHGEKPSIVFTEPVYYAWDVLFHLREERVASLEYVDQLGPRPRRRLVIDEVDRADPPLTPSRRTVVHRAISKLGRVVRSG